MLDAPVDVGGHDSGARPIGDVTILVEHEDRNAIAAAEGMGVQRPAKRDTRSPISCHVRRRPSKIVAVPHDLTCKARRSPCVMFIA
jgi:hypothetical protein